LPTYINSENVVESSKGRDIIPFMPAVLCCGLVHLVCYVTFAAFLLQQGACRKCGFVCRHFKLILHRNVDVLSSDFEAFVVSVGNRQQSTDVEGEFYHGFEECKFFPSFL